MKFALAALPLLSVALAQSSASSAVASASEAVSSAAGSATGSASSTASGEMPMQSGMAGDYLTQVLGALNANNLTALAGIATTLASTPEGMALFTQLSQGNKTVFAPSNEAFSAVPEEVSSNTTLLGQILSYHILNDSYTPSGVQVSPAHSIARTLLRGDQYELPGNRSAPLVLSRNSSDAEMFEIIQSEQITAMGPVAAANLQVYIIDQVLTTPPTLSTLATELAPSLAGVIQMANLLTALEETPGLTIFAPNDAAIAAVASTIQTLNETTVQTILANHVINGTVAYSDRITTENYTSAAGSPFTFMTNDTGTYVMSGDATAMIVATDAIYNKGVIHVIDAVLVNTMSNPEAAASAAGSASSAIATATEPTGPMTMTSDPAASGSQSGSGSSAPNAASRASWNFGGLGLGSVIAAVGVVLGGGAVLL